VRMPRQGILRVALCRRRVRRRLRAGCRRPRMYGARYGCVLRHARWSDSQRALPPGFGEGHTWLHFIGYSLSSKVFTAIFGFPVLHRYRCRYYVSLFMLILCASFPLHAMATARHDSVNKTCAVSRSTVNSQCAVSGLCGMASC